jgi:heterogeneous nuclear ribonucleoprotein U-like protein 1
MEINKQSLCSARAMSESGFGHLWAGVRATYGSTRGRVCFEVAIDGNQPTSHLENEPSPHVLRCGWSVDTAGLQLGTEHLSFGFGGTGKVSTNNKFVNYGKPFGVKDIVGCYLVIFIPCY